MFDPTQDPILSIRNVGVSYRRKVGLSKSVPFDALTDVSFDVYHGESLGVIGRNGAGKSSLMRVLSGIICPDRGKVVRRTQSITLLSLQVGFDPQLSGRDNAILSGMLLGLDKRTMRARLDDIREFSELGEFFDQPLHTYSNGMRARLGFSTAIYLDPEVMLIDEVLAVGDAGFREKSSKVMEERINSDRTVVIVSHSPELLRKLCNRAVWIENGVTRLEDDVDVVLKEYHRSVAGKDRRN